MKAYPLIYSRTKNYDFVPDFLVRPKDLDYTTALKYVTDAMSTLDFLNGIRYTAFSAGAYCICGGIACLSRNLFDVLKKTNALDMGTSYADAEEYLKDCKGRNLACFIGIAIPKSEVKAGVIPSIPLERYWNIYLEYLKHQWDSVKDTESEKLELPPLVLEEKSYQTMFQPNLKTINGRLVMQQEYFNSYQQQILDYFFYRILSGNSDSLITEINIKNMWDKSVFQTAAVSAELYALLNSAPQASFSKPQANSVLKAPESVADDGSVHIKKTAPQTPRSSVQKNQWNSVGTQKKTISPNKPPSARKMPAIIAAIVVIIILLLILKHLI